jgi:predicted dehydrogenase/threonine dehydrogenase-like Zn-dependent dehydrogenase
MRQVLLTNEGVKVARMPAPTIEAGSVLIRVEYSMISVGTEVAGLRKPDLEPSTTLGQAKVISAQARRYFHKAITNPRLAAARIKKIGNRYLSRLIQEHSSKRSVDAPLNELLWQKQNADEFIAGEGGIQITTDGSDWHYQAITSFFQIPEGNLVAIDIAGEIKTGKILVGILDELGEKWLSNRVLLPGQLNDRLIFDPRGASGAKLVISNAQGGSSKASFEKFSVLTVSPSPDGVPLSEMEEIGWNLGYSAAGTVVSVGEGVSDIFPGDRVACGGAGKANHADFVLVPRNLLARVPDGCETRWASTTTIGAIALQGVRRAQPVLGERICVIGLGMLGQLTVQLLRASGCQVLGIDLDKRRVERAKSLGMEFGVSDPLDLARVVRDFTSGQGVDRTLITAATKSDTVINSAMEVTRRRGTVVIVGDIGMHIERAHFYRKEIDLLMSTSYGPGRYDSKYEEQGIDYPFAYVRWTLNRNMQSYMELIASGRLNIASLVDVFAPVDDATALYNNLANSKEPPMGVIFEYKAKENFDETEEGTSVHLRGSRTDQTGKVNYVLVGAGAYGIAMLVPMLDKHQDRFFLRGVVSRDTIRGGNFVRDRRLGVFSSNLDDVVNDADNHMVVIATRHIDHTQQVVCALKAGKHVFVEKPLAINWEQLNSVVTCYESLNIKPVLMVGFNRRFSPAVKALKEVLIGRTSPLMINYRLNGGYIPLDHWIQNDQGGGRNIGEACHMYDVFRSLIGTQVVSAAATGINPGGKPYLPSDNFTASMSYGDGSVASLFYTALGPKQGLPKERIEVFCDGEAYIIDDFKQLIRASNSEVIWSSNEVDKGQSTQMSELADSLYKKGVAPIPFEEIIETTALALFVEDMLYGRSSPLDLDDF